ncbi:MAG TPA: menaquinone biosynthesis decarboxylase [Verrucomicrobiae bacterium]|nr:menaquinone biosynthesis decarboxylase [Verrucomicrobiae bacterium]
MPYDSLRDFVQRLDAAGELKRIPVEVDPVLEITEIADREMKSPGGGKALFFEKCKGSRFPLLINAYGSTKRMAMALGVNDVEDIARELEGLLKAKPPTSFKEAISLLGTAFELRHAKPKTVKSGPCREVVERTTDLTALPIQQCWPQDAGRFVCLPLVITRDPDNGSRNVGAYRMQVIDAQTTFMHWQLHKTGARHWRRYMELKQRMPVAVALGGDPVYAFAATAPLPDGIDEMMFAGFLRKKSVEMVTCDTNDLEVPADCDFVLEGYVEPEEKLDLEGPFGDHTGYYTLPEPYPKFHVERITHCRDAIYPSTIVGIPPMEDFYMGTASVRVFLPVFKTNFNEIVDMALPAEGVFHNLVIVSIKKLFPYHAMKVMHGLWGMGQMMFTKMIVVVDADVNVHDTSEVLFRVCANVDPERDIIVTKGPADVLDHATPVMGFGSKIGIDATHKLKGEANTRPWPPIIKMDDAVKKRVDELLRHGR